MPLPGSEVSLFPTQRSRARPSAHSDTPSLPEESNQNTMSHAVDPQPSIRDSASIWHAPTPALPALSLSPPPYEKVPLQPDQVLPGLPTCPPCVQSRVPPALAPLLPITVRPSWLSGRVSSVEPQPQEMPLPLPAALTCVSHPCPGFQDPSPWGFLPWSDPSFSVFLKGSFSSHPTPTPPPEVSVSWLCLHPWFSPPYTPLG